MSKQKVYGFTVLTFADFQGMVPTTDTRVFRTKQELEDSMDSLSLDENQEINTFETILA